MPDTGQYLKYLLVTRGTQFLPSGMPTNARETYICMHVRFKQSQVLQNRAAESRIKTFLSFYSHIKAQPLTCIEFYRRVKMYIVE